MGYQLILRTSSNRFPYQLIYQIMTLLHDSDPDVLFSLGILAPNRSSFKLLLVQTSTLTVDIIC